MKRKKMYRPGTPTQTGILRRNNRSNNSHRNIAKHINVVYGRI
jgi:hypothetical protein